MSIEKIVQEELASAEKRIMARIRDVFDSIGSGVSSSTKAGGTKEKAKAKAKTKAKRVMHDYEALAEKMATFVTKNPGTTGNEIREALGIGEAVFVKTLRAGSKKISKRGMRRGMRYFPKGYRVTGPSDDAPVLQ